MIPLVLLRHGQSTWNLENRFTGWTDVDLTDQGRAEAAEGGRLLKEGGYTFDLALHLALEARHPDAVDRARRDGPHVGAGLEHLAPERAPLRRAAGAQQGRDGREVRRPAGAHLAPQLRRAAAAPDGGRRAVPGSRSALRLARQHGPAADRVPQGHHRAIPAVLGGHHRAPDPGRPARDHRRARQQPARAGEAPRPRVRRRTSWSSTSPPASRSCTSWTKRRCSRHATSTWATPRPRRRRPPRSRARARRSSPPAALPALSRDRARSAARSRPKYECCDINSF